MSFAASPKNLLNFSRLVVGAALRGRPGHIAVNLGATLPDPHL